MTKPLRAISWASVSSLPQMADDKISIEEQLRLNTEWCAVNHADIVDTLVIPGHSRYESDLVELLDDYAQQGIWAYHRIREHWNARVFDDTDSVVTKTGTGVYQLVIYVPYALASCGTWHYDGQALDGSANSLLVESSGFCAGFGGLNE